VPYVPNDITFEVDDANGDITFTLGEWMHESLENATQGLSCSSNTKRSLPDLMPRDLESCSLDPYVAHIAANIELINRAVAALPEPVQNLINQYVRIDLIALGLDPRVSSPGKY
jgi:hypothetical protein